jgi:hypothetical protein
VEVLNVEANHLQVELGTFDYYVQNICTVADPGLTIGRQSQPVPRFIDHVRWCNIETSVLVNSNYQCGLGRDEPCLGADVGPFCADFAGGGMPAMPGEWRGDEVVGLADLVELLASWGPCPLIGEPCFPDTRPEGEPDWVVGFADMLVVLDQMGGVCMQVPLPAMLRAIGVGPTAL